MFDPRLALTFVVVAEARSFTRAAERLGVAQPWVSEQLRRLESQLGFRLLTRSSRSVELTPPGEEFLTHALALAEANRSAQAFAQETVKGLNRTLRVGAIDLLTDFNERSELIGRFVQAYPTARLQIEGGRALSLQKRLLDGDIDAFIGFIGSFDLGLAFESAWLCQRIAQVMIPLESPLSGLDVLPISALSGATVVSAPGQTDSAALQIAFRPLLDCGATLVPAPEANRITIEHMARIRRMICMRWTRQSRPREVLGNMVCIPLVGDPLRLDVAVFARRNRWRTITRDFIATARAVGEGYAAAAAPIMASRRT